MGLERRMRLRSFLGWLRAKWFDRCLFTLSNTVPGPLTADKLTGMKSTHPKGMSLEGNGRCLSCVISTKSPSVSETLHRRVFRSPILTCIYLCMCVFSKLRISAQSGPVIMVVLCH